MTTINPVSTNKIGTDIQLVGNPFAALLGSSLRASGKLRVRFARAHQFMRSHRSKHESSRIYDMDRGDHSPDRKSGIPAARPSSERRWPCGCQLATAAMS
jgi:hypothetical protein